IPKFATAPIFTDPQRKVEVLGLRASDGFGRHQDGERIWVRSDLGGFAGIRVENLWLAVADGDLKLAVNKIGLPNSAVCPMDDAVFPRACFRVAGSRNLLRTAGRHARLDASRETKEQENPRQCNSARHSEAVYNGLCISRKQVSKK